MSWREYSQTRAMPANYQMSNCAYSLSHANTDSRLMKGKGVELTKVLDVLIGNELGHDLRNATLNTAGEVSLIHDDSIGDGGGDEGKAISEDGSAGGRVEGNEGECVAEDRDEEKQMSILGQRFEVPSRKKSLYSIVDEVVGIGGCTYPMNQANLQKGIESVLNRVD